MLGITCDFPFSKNEIAIRLSTQRLTLLGLGFRARGFRFGTGFGAWGLRFRLAGFRDYRVQGLGFRVGL